MSGFGFTEAQEMFRRQAQDFARRELLPGARERSREGLLPREIVKKAADLGYMAINAPAEYGGQPVDWITLGIAVEELAKVELLVSCLPPWSSFAAALLQVNPDLLREWIPALVRGQRLLCLALTEPDCGSDAAAIRTRALREGDSYILQGEKTPVSLAMHADGVIAFAKTDPGAGARGVSSFLVPFDLPGIERSPHAMMGWNSIGQASIILDGVRVPRRYLLGEEGGAFGTIMKQFDSSRVYLSLQVLGMAQTSLEEAIAYAQQRTAFGQAIAKFEGVSFKIAEAATMVEAARLLCYRTLWLKDQGLPHSRESAMCKWLAPQVAVRTIHDCLLIHGHVGYSQEYDLGLRLMDAIGFEIADGMAQVMKLIVARSIWGREFIP
jgi:cyclohexanecarboxyl-CoA dehydrogenase